MKIAYLISRYPAVSHTFILREICQLRNLGFQIKVASINKTDIVLEKQTEVEKQEIASTFYVKELGFFSFFYHFIKALVTRPIGFFKGLKKCLSLAGFDIKRIFYHFFYFGEALVIGDWMNRLAISHLHVHFGNPASTVALILSQIYPVTYSMMIHGPDEFYDVTLNALEEKIRLAKFVCCIGSFAKSQLMRLSNRKEWDKLEVVPLGVSPEDFRSCRKIKKESFQLLSIGRLVPGKGHMVLLEALEELKKLRKKVHLIIVGEGPERQALLQEIKQRHLENFVELTGALGQKEILELYRRADAFILPSFAEGIPVVLMEAMAMKIPCVATFVNGIPELIQNGENGLLVAPSDSEALKEAILKLMEDPILREQLGNSARESVVARYQLVPNVLELGKVFGEYL